MEPSARREKPGFGRLRLGCPVVLSLDWQIETHMATIGDALLRLSLDGVYPLSHPPCLFERVALSEIPIGYRVVSKVIARGLGYNELVNNPGSPEDSSAKICVGSRDSPGRHMGGHVKMQSKIKG